MKKIIFFILTFIVILLSLSATIEIVRMMREFSVKTPDELAFMIGFVVYLLVHFLLYKPVFAHVMAHELTHMLWASLFGGKTKELRVSKEGGRVLISKSNFMISLAPYFFPLYALIGTLIYYIARDEFRMYVAFLVGVALSFHIALTLFSLMTRQDDLHEDSNIVFSLAFVLLMNILVIAFILAVVSGKINYIVFLRDVLFGCWHIIKWAGLFVHNLGRVGN